MEAITRIAEDKLAENDRFRLFLGERNSSQIDEWVSKLDQEITQKIDCTACGNCCKSLMIVVTDEEASLLSDHLQQKRENFDQQYLEKGSNGMMLINQIPCHFLADNKCTVYDYRFAGCREFPALHIPDFKNRLFTIFMHYDRCPIIFNVVEKLKLAMGFETDGSE